MAFKRKSKFKRMKTRKSGRYPIFPGGSRI